MTRLNSKGIYTIKVGNYPHTNMLPKSEIMRRGGYKFRTLEMHQQLRDQQLKTISYIYRLLYQNFRITANQKSTIDTQTNKKDQLKYNTKDIHQTTEERTREEEKRTTKPNPKQLI